MKKFIKRSFIVLAIVIAVAIGASLNSNDDKKPASEPASSQPTEKPKENKPGKMTKDQYDQIVVGDSLSGEGGMTIDEAINKFGKPETRTESQSGNLKMEMLVWNAEGDFGANATITFINGKASGKSNFGMK